MEKAWRSARGGLVLAAALACAGGCRKGPEQAAHTIGPDPARTEDATPKETEAKDPPLTLLHASVIDLAGPSIVTVLEPDLPQREASYEGGGLSVAYVLAKATSVLRAYDMHSGKLRWSAAIAGGCKSLVGLSGGALCSKDAEVILYDVQTGLPRPLGSASTSEVTDVLPIRGGARVFIGRADTSIEVYDGATLARLGGGGLPFVVYGPWSGQTLAETDGGVCAAATNVTGLEIHCLDDSGSPVWSRTYPLAKATDPSGTRFSVRDIGPRWVVATTFLGWSTPVRRGIVVRLSDGVELARVEEEIASAVAKEDGTLEGLLVTYGAPGTKGVRFLEPSGKLRWSVPDVLESSASALLVNDMIVAATFHPIATGADLRAYDRTTGKPRWIADVKLEPIAHSKYHNDVKLSISHGLVVMRGDESGQSYLELFSPSDGARKFTELRTTW
jgi:outer membrane protein assembly factor BamB